MNWNAREMANHFLIRANAIHPDEGFSESEKAGMMGTQDLFYQCYVNSFDRSKLIEFLNATVSGDVKVPDDIDEQDAYREGFMAAAKRVKMEVEK